MKVLHGNPDLIKSELMKLHGKYYVCAYCYCVFDRETDKLVAQLDHLNEALSHSVCMPCAEEELRKVDNARDSLEGGGVNVRQPGN